MYVGIDIGGTRCRVLVVPTIEITNDRSRHEFVLSHDFDNDMAELIRTIKQHASAKDIKAVGLSVPGDLNADKTMFADPSDNLTEWSDKPVKAILEREFQCPIVMENDGAAAALGEAYFGAGKGKDFCFVIWGTGIGGAQVVCKNGVVTCAVLDWYRYFDVWEQHCGGNRLQQRFGKPASQLTEGEWNEVMQDFQKYLGQFISDTDARCVVFGGGVAIKQQERLLACAKNYSSVDVRISELGEDAGLYGALALLEPSQQ